VRLLLRNAGLLVVLVTAVLAEVVRVSFPLLYGFAERIGFTTAAGVIPLLFAIGLLAAPIGRLVGPRVLLGVAGGGLAVARIAMQVQFTPALVVTFTGLLLGFVALAVALRVGVARVGPLTTASAVFLGLALDTAIRLALTTWDAAWRHDAFSWTVGLALPVLLALVLVAVLRDDAAGWGPDAWWFAALPGPLLVLQTLFMASPPFVASSGQLGLPTAGAVVLVGLGLAAATPPVRGPLAWVAWAVLVVVAGGLAGPGGWSGWIVPLCVLAAQVAIGALVATAAVRAHRVGEGRVEDGRERAWQTGLGAGVAALVVVVTLLPYQISYDLDLFRDIPQRVWTVIAAAVVVLMARSAPGPEGDPPSRVSPLRWVGALGPIPLLAVPAWLAVTWPSVAAPADDRGGVRVATYNIHSAIDWFGRLDPEQIAQVLERDGAEIVMLQEVSRGWPLGGGLDSADWLARRLGMEIAYGPAADNQFGNAVLAARPILDSWSATLDRGEGPMRRGYVGVTVALGGTTIDVWSTHLQHRDDTTLTRQAQARLLLEEWNRRERTVIGGDLNSRPDSEDILPWFDGTDLVSAQDEAGDPAWNTSPALNADHRIDWILGTPDLTFSDAAVPQTLASDHLPVFVTVSVD
jgi:endonuclease/exonuclease/phosphatase family metal-dependent hydrolase